MISTADWDNPYWTNKQHVAVELGRTGHRILYVESLGLRRPTASARDLARIWRRLKSGFRPPRRVRPNIWVLSPLIIPFQSSAMVRRLNGGFLSFSVWLWARVLGLRPKLLWTYSPLTPELCDLAKWELVVYHAVDDIKAQPGMPREVIAASEEKLSRRADLIFTTAPNLYEAHRLLNPETYYFPNVADFDHFNKALDPNAEIPVDLAEIPQPRVGFIGAISGYKLDFPLIRSLAEANPDWSIVMIGEVGEGDPWTDITQLENLPNIHLLGGRPYQSLPNYLKGMDVAILPNLPNEYTRSMFPMKFFEYLAAGRRVVGTTLPALQDYGHVAAFVDGAPGFAAAVADAIAGRGATLEERLAAAREQTYEIRTERMMALVEKHLAEKGAQG